MNWLLNTLFPDTFGRTIRISRDNLPGLVAPKVAPPRPKMPEQKPELRPSIEATYRMFKASKAQGKTKKPHDRGVGF